jgi:methionine biosynthesis protein MetW
MTPDTSALGFLDSLPPHDRYETFYDPDEASGIICRLIPNGAHVLDVGCGTGSLGAIIERRCGAKVLGIEPDAERAELARRAGLEVVRGEFDDGFVRRSPAFDVVLFADVLEHVAAPFELLERAQRCLAPSGQIVVSVPNAAHWSMRVMVARGSFVYQPYGILDATHLRWFTESTLIRFMERAGCRVTAVRFSTGHHLAAYRRRPWSWISQARRRDLIRSMSRLAPRMFGCQIIVSAIGSSRSEHS